MSAVLKSADRVLLELYREGAIEARLTAKPPELVVEFRSDDTKGAIKVWLGPLRVQETVLLG